MVSALERLLTDRAMHLRLKDLSAHMQAADGRRKAARLIDGLLRLSSASPCTP
jgi:UDP:flavonoid glycosyltransferase YjiC (YdhE family)